MYVYMQTYAHMRGHTYVTHISLQTLNTYTYLLSTYQRLLVGTQNPLAFLQHHRIQCNHGPSQI